MLRPDSRIYVAGHRGLAGRAIIKALESRGYRSLLVKAHDEVDLTSQPAVEAFFSDQRPDIVFLAAARVGGIVANDSQPAEFIRDNLAIQTNVIHAAWQHGCAKLVFLGSSCIYPKLATQPMREDALLTGPLEPTNEWYAIAKIAGVKMCQAYRRQYGFDAISLMPTNLYGPGDNFDLNHSHVLPALIRKFHEAKLDGNRDVTIWGTGTPRREFLYSDDLGDAAVFLAEHYSDHDPVNVGTGEDIMIRDLASLVQQVVGHAGEIILDTTRPDGTPRKQLDVSRLTSLGWTAAVDLEDGIRATYDWYLKNPDQRRL